MREKVLNSFTKPDSTLRLLIGEGEDKGGPSFPLGIVFAPSP